ncbi:MAG: SPOR domain-containing protein, partial [Firmicutes bacterium]|nr:SPOR domain-containing protein [Bacillota bacterium]
KQEQETEVNTTPEKGYALQFGAFSTEEAAKELSKQLESKGVDTEIVRTGDIYKVISQIAGDRETVLSALEDIKNKEITDVFIASFQ